MNANIRTEVQCARLKWLQFKKKKKKKKKTTKKRKINLAVLSHTGSYTYFCEWYNFPTKNSWCKQVQICNSRPEFFVPHFIIFFFFKNVLCSVNDYVLVTEYSSIFGMY